MKPKSESESPNTTSAKEPESASSTATPVVASEGEAVTQGATEGDPVTVIVKPPKKRKAGLIIGIVVFLLFLIGLGSLAVWYFAVYNNPDVVAADAVRQFLTAENVVTTGNVRLASEVDSTTGHQIVASVSVASAANSLPNTVDVTLMLSEQDSAGKVVDDHQIIVFLGSAVTSDGVIYFRVSGLAQAVDDALAASGSSIDEYGALGSLAYDIVELIDNEWWQISLSELADALEIDSSISDPALDYYRCLLGIDTGAHSGALASLYQQNHFIVLEKAQEASLDSSVNRYAVSVNASALASFINALPDTALVNEVMVCYNDFATVMDLDTVSTADFPEVSAEEIADVLPEQLDLYVEISRAGHRLRRVIYTPDTQDPSISANFEFTYENVAISTPDSYRPITDLVDDILDLLAEYFETPDELPEFELEV